MYIKKHECKTIAEVIKHNTGMEADEFAKPRPLPFIKNIKEAAEMIMNLKDKTKFHIIGDYDVDGVMATAILYKGLKKIGINATTRIPKRFSEGYGLSEKIIDEINEGVIITVDNGIAALGAIKKAKNKGLKVIVTDHHLGVTDDEENLILPDADIIVDAHVDNESEFDDYCGAMTAYRLVSELLGKDDAELLTFASIATVCDVMPLVGPNRDVVRAGLMLINKGVGGKPLRTLMNELKISNVDESTYGFSIGPCINASGRLFDNGAEKVLAYLLSDDADISLDFKVKPIVRNNETRKKVVKEALSNIEVKTRPIVLYNETYGEGVIGIIAGKLCEKYACPVIVFTKSSTLGVLKGSGRSIKGIHLKKTLDRMSDILCGYGGHEQAAGLSIKEKDLELFTERFAKEVGTLPKMTSDVFYDLEINLDNISNELRELEKYAPYGEGNPRPVYHGIFKATEAYRPIGDGSHFMLKCGNITLLGFDLCSKYESFKSGGIHPQKLEAIGYLIKEVYKGKEQYKFELIDFKPIEE